MEVQADQQMLQITFAEDGGVFRIACKFGNRILR